MAENYGIVKKRVMTDASLSVAAKGAYAYLSTYGVDSFPKISTVCRELSVTHHTLLKYLKELEKHGYLKVERRYKQSNIYHLM